MNEDAINDAYALFSSKGYNGKINEFKSLIASNPDALKDSYALFRSSGYNGDINQYSELIGLKKKESSEVSPSKPSAKPSASVTSPKVSQPTDGRAPIQPTFRTEAPDIFGGVKPVAKKAPEAPKDQLSPVAKAQVQARVAKGEVAETPAKKNRCSPTGYRIGTIFIPTSC